jgi:hypothetical protein
MNSTRVFFPEDGAKFFACIQPAGDLYRASCRACLDLRYALDEEMPECHLSRTWAKARAWIHSVAAERGFDRIYWPVEEGQGRALQ